MSQHYSRGQNQPQQPYYPQQNHQPPQHPPVAPQKKPMTRSAKIGWGALAGSVVFALGAAAGNAGANGMPTTSVAAGASTPTVTVTQPGDTVTVTAPPAQPTTAPSSAAKPATKPKATVAPRTTAKPKPVVYKKLTARQWAKIAKSPDDHLGEAYVVYGVVTQFDAATGEDTFRADVDGVRHRVEYGYVDYPTNTLLTNVSGDVSDLVQDDLFQANVLVLGSFSYDTQIGGETTVPNLSVISIKVTGSTK
ncbi:serine/threonine protein kinase [Kribbella capetownensis]|uniref:Serine/threonine protein kinase n=1 Tax=Kribbella capetownensis TaxID=1572659 RepID=A0A4R0J2U6_9ACTN|nr:serine/threonine protein kinase [Kribbella capetownensis]TCC40007.1 serine/threonine protein kinase [Kribbella capetownensis]